ncbi:hypothetical protein DB347_16535 [Opitutaceae bacterium EW11]|nr:hypothetical protein DB347_16535 [Opitutaceae bacterium EW11]
MTSQNTTLLFGRARFSRILLLGALAALSAEARALSLPQRVLRSSTEPRQTVVAASEAIGYLASVGPVPLRFAPPPPDPVERPAPPASAAVASTPVSPVPSVAPTVQPEPATATAAPGPEPAATQPAAEKQPELKPVTILPDDTRRDVRPEDVLPYFELPRGSAGAGGAALPFAPAAPPAQPPSSATYQQK